MGLGFDEVRFPTDIAPGTQGGAMFSTLVTITTSGGEFRVQQWSSARRRWTVGHEGTDVTSQAVVAFHYARAGRARGFRYRDWTDYKAVQELMHYTGVGFSSPARYRFQLQKTYQDVVNPYIRKVLKPCSDATLSIYKQPLGTGALALVDPALYAVDYTTGLIDVQMSAPGPGLDNYYASFWFDVPVRFDSDQLEHTQESPWHRVLVPVPIVEVLDA